MIIGSVVVLVLHDLTAEPVYWCHALCFDKTVICIVDGQLEGALKNSNV